MNCWSRGFQKPHSSHHICMWSKSIVIQNNRSIKFTLVSEKKLWSISIELVWNSKLFTVWMTFKNIYLINQFMVAIWNVDLPILQRKKDIAVKLTIPYLPLFFSSFLSAYQVLIYGADGSRSFLFSYSMWCSTQWSLLWFLWICQLNQYCPSIATMSKAGNEHMPRGVYKVGQYICERMMGRISCPN